MEQSGRRAAGGGQAGGRRASRWSAGKQAVGGEASSGQAGSEPPAWSGLVLGNRMNAATTTVTFLSSSRLPTSPPLHPGHWRGRRAGVGGGSIVVSIRVGGKASFVVVNVPPGNADGNGGAPGYILNNTTQTRRPELQQLSYQSPPGVTATSPLESTRLLLAAAAPTTTNARHRTPPPSPPSAT